MKEHPYPWRWNPASITGTVHVPGEDATGLDDVKRGFVMDACDGVVQFSSPLASELIRLAPEMEKVLRSVVSIFAGERWVDHPKIRKARDILSALDSVRDGMR